MPSKATMTNLTRYRRRGNVLVMVISMLVMLFVFGTTFLLTARFDKISAQDSAKVAGGANSGNSQSAKVAELISVDIRRQLRDDVVGGTGQPYDGAALGTNNDVVKDFGDAPGLDGLLSALEPSWDATVLPGGDYVWYRVTTPRDNLESLKISGSLGQQYPAGTDDTTLSNIPINSAIDLSLPFPGGSWPGPHNMQFEWLQVTSTGVSPVVPDAEGDGMPSAMVWARADRENNPLVLDDDVPAIQSFGDRYAAAVRVLPNGAMVTAYHQQLDSGFWGSTPDGLSQVLTNVSGDADLSAALFQNLIDPQVEEPVLRNRFFLPRDFQNIQNVPTPLETEWANTLLPASLQIGPRYRSWPIDYGVGNIADNENWWASRLDPTSADYDRRHLITTISYDDLYRRKAYGTAETQKSIIINGLGQRILLSEVLKRYPNFAPSFNTPSSHADGKLMFSLRGLVDTEGFVLPGQGGPLKGEQLVYLYAYFRAMLENVDNSLMSDSQRARTAAALAINTWDFFDADHEPTYSTDIYGAQGFYDPAPGAVLGIEGQPFLTEVHVQDSNDPDGDFDIFAVEIFNPWPWDITLAGDGTIPGSEWGLSNGGGLPDGTGILPLDNVITIPAANTIGLVNITGAPATRNLSVISNVVPAPFVAAPHDITNQQPANGVSIDGIVKSERVALHRKIGPAPGFWVKVDQIEADGVNQPDSVTDWIASEPAVDYSASLQRELLAEGAGVFRSTWKFCIGAEDQVGGHTLGAANTGVTIGGAKGVPLVWNDTGIPERAFPTTATLLLVPAIANEGGVPFSKIVADDVDRVDQIDSGHMPIFDQQDDSDPINLRANVWEPWQTSSGDYNAEDLPWGQLVFDYFTVLPLKPVMTPQERTTYAGLPIVEKVVDLKGNTMYGPRVKGRININAAPWTIMDGIPVLANDPLELPVLELLDLPATIDNPNFGTPGVRLEWFENTGGVWTITPAFAQLIQSYREKRDVEGSQVMGDNLGIARRLGARTGDGMLSVGELANVILSAGNDDAAEFGWNIGTLNYLDVVAPLVRITDWVTVKSNVYTVYITVADREEEDGTVRMLQTIDRTNTFYTDDLPAVVSQTVLKQ